MSIALDQRIKEIERQIAELTGRRDANDRAIEAIDAVLARLDALENKRKTLTVPK